MCVSVCGWGGGGEGEGGGGVEVVFGGDVGGVGGCVGGGGAGGGREGGGRWDGVEMEEGEVEEKGAERWIVWGRRARRWRGEGNAEMGRLKA